MHRGREEGVFDEMPHAVTYHSISLFIALCLSGILNVLGEHNQVEQVDHSARTIRPNFRLEQTFTKSGVSLGLCAIPPIVDPIESRERLFVFRKGKQTEIPDLTSLRGHVHIDSAEQALSFVRLKTSPRTFHAFYRSGAPTEMEVIPKDELLASLVFGDKHFAEQMKNAENGYCGIVSEQVFDHLGCRRVQCAASDNGFVVKRTLMSVTPDSHKVRFIILAEQVSQDGTYVVKQRLETRLQATPAVRWAIRRFE